MTPHTRMRPVLVLAAVVLALTGCAGTAQPAPSSPNTTYSATPTPSIEASTGPAVVGPPNSESEAIAEANRSLLEYYSASFLSGHAGGTLLNAVAPWATGPALKNEELLADYLRQKKYRLDGTPTQWTLSQSLSSAAQTTEASSGGTIAFGSVQLVGCIESTNRPVGAGAPVWTTKGKHTSIQWSVLYDATTRQWRVYGSSPVTAGGSLPCA